MTSCATWCHQSRTATPTTRRRSRYMIGRARHAPRASNDAGLLRSDAALLCADDRSPISCPPPLKAVRLVDAGSNRSLRTARSSLRARTARFASSHNTWRDCALRQSTLVCCAQTLRSCALTIDLPSRVDLMRKPPPTLYLNVRIPSGPTDGGRDSFERSGPPSPSGRYVMGCSKTCCRGWKAHICCK